MTLPSAAEVGVELARAMRANEGLPPDPEQYRALVDLLMDAPAETPVDALALVAWLAVILPGATAQADDDALKLLLAACSRMAGRAEAALVATTGIPPEAFTGPPGRTN